MSLYHHTLIHDCKIDCSNPSEVMRILMTKSDQLYLFWQNYNNLYQAYKTLLIEVEALKKEKIDKKDNNISGFEQYIKSLQESHEKERKRLIKEKQEYSKLLDLKDYQINKLTEEIKVLKMKNENIPIKTDNIDPRIIEDRMKQQFKRILRDLQRKYAANLRQQLQTAKWEVSKQVGKIMSHTAQACVNDIIQQTIETTVIR